MGKYNVLLPKTSFSMKANLKEKEPLIQDFWEKSEIYEKIIAKNRGKPAFILHDGPPYANGHIHMGHALNKILKDILVKHKNASGFLAPFVPGWDCHGLPIEYQLLKELGIKKSQISRIEFRKKAQAFVKKFINIQLKEFKRLGIFADWKNPYLTMKKEYEAQILKIFSKLVEKNFIWRGEKPVYWCPECETALAEAEVEYREKTSDSIFVLFKCEELGKNTYAVVWTTTPWTLPSNVALAFNRNFLYTIFEVGDRQFISVEEKREEILKILNAKESKIIAQYKGDFFVGKKFSHPFKNQFSVGVESDFVEKQEGTGIVHIAPGHGEEDFAVGLKYNLPVLSPVDEKGVFTEKAQKFAGLNVFKANPLIIEELKNKNALIYNDKITHTYPHCWRCKNPVIFRATPQWFISIDKNNLREKLLSEIKHVEWVPKEGEKRISAMVEMRPDWCISRQRYWGVPIPVFYCEDCGRTIIDAKIISKIACLVEEKGTEILLQETPPVEITCPCGSRKIKRDPDILDVWFDSGASFSVLKKTPLHRFPSDMYLEGSDQHRGWFQTSLILSCATEGCAPYRTVVTHGFVVDGKGQKMSKSLGNVITPQEIIERSGADILRIWCVLQDYSVDLKISEEILKSCVETYRKIRNTLKFLLGNLNGFNPSQKIPFEKMEAVDRFALIEMEKIKKKVLKNYKSYNFSQSFKEIFNFSNIFLSSFYLDILKDRLYTFRENSPERKSAQQALWEIFKNLTILLAPVISHTAEEAWQCAKNEISNDLEESVFLADIPQEKFFEGTSFKEKWQKLLSIRNVVTKALEIAREKGEIGNSLEAGIWISEEKFLKEFSQDQLKEVFLVSELRKPDTNEIISSFTDKGISVEVFRAKGKKCARCWRITQDVEGDICARCRRVLNPA